MLGRVTKIRLFLVFAFMALLIALTALLAYRDAQFYTQSDAQAAQSHAIRTQLQQLLSTLQDAETGQRGYLLTGNNNYLEPYQAAKLRLERQLAQLDALITARPVRFSIMPEISTVGDPGLLRIVLENLINNAWKFTRRRPDGLIEFGTIQHEDGPVHFVRDNGAGFDMSYANRLFRPFQRLHAETDFEGTGVGLATVARIVQRHGGEIWAEGEIGKGATFYFTLKAADTDQDTASTA